MIDSNQKKFTQNAESKAKAQNEESKATQILIEFDEQIKNDPLNDITLLYGWQQDNMFSPNDGLKGYRSDKIYVRSNKKYQIKIENQAKNSSQARMKINKQQKSKEYLKKILNHLETHRSHTKNMKNTMNQINYPSINQYHLSKNQPTKVETEESTINLNNKLSYLKYTQSQRIKSTELKLIKSSNKTNQNIDQNQMTKNSTLILQKQSKSNKTTTLDKAITFGKSYELSECEINKQREIINQLIHGIKRSQISKDIFARNDSKLRIHKESLVKRRRNKVFTLDKLIF